MEVIKEIAKALKTSYKDIPIYSNVIMQGFSLPSFQIELVSFRDIAVAGIKFNKIYQVDVIYRSKDFKLDPGKLKAVLEKNIKKYKIISYDIEFVENDLHFIIDVLDKSSKKEFEIPENSFYGKLKTAVERITNKKCYLYTTDLNTAALEKGFYLIKPENLITSTISLMHNKSKDREVTLIYLEDSERNPIEVAQENEDNLDAILNDLEFRKNYINMDYEMTVEFESEEDYFTDLIYFNILLNIKERNI